LKDGKNRDGTMEVIEETLPEKDPLTTN